MLEWVWVCIRSAPTFFLIDELRIKLLKLLQRFACVMYERYDTNVDKVGNNPM